MTKAPPPGVGSLETRSRPQPITITTTAAAAAAAAAALLAGCASSPAPEVHGTRDKGSDAVEILVEGRGWLAPGDAIHPGDRLHVRVPGGAPGEVWLGDGERMFGRFAVAAARPTLSPFALMVDAAPGDEVLFGDAEMHALAKDYSAQLAAMKLA